MEEKIVFESNDELLVTQIEALLKDNEITYVRRELGCGSYTTILMGQSFSTKQIVVHENDYEKAMELVNLFNDAEFELPDELKEEEEIEEE